MSLPHAQAGPESVRVLRALVAGLWLVQFALTPLHRLADVPMSAWRPPGYLDALGGFGTALVAPLPLTLLRVGGVAALAAFIVARRGRAPGLVAAVLVTLADALGRSFGHVGHAGIPALLALWLLVAFAFAPPVPSRTAAASGGTSRLNPWSVPFVAVIAVLALTYAFTGIFRLAHGGPWLFASTSMEFWAIDRGLWSEAGASGAGLGRLLLERPALGLPLNATFAAVTAFEVLAPFVLVSGAFRWIFLAAMLGFHVGTWAVMNIAFTENAVLLLALLPFSRWLAPRPRTDGEPVVFFDGECTLCDGFVSWLIARDRTGRYRVAPLQGRTASSVGAAPGGPDGAGETIVLVEGPRRYERSGAVLRILDGLGGVWRLAALVGRVLPTPLRDSGYAWVARHRHAWFGRREACRLPDADEAARFLP